MKKNKPYFFVKDNRGSITGISQGQLWEEINYLESKKNTTRGNHYHKKTIEGFFIIDGKIEVSILNLKSKKETKFIAQKGDSFYIEPFELHTFKILEASEWINFLSKSMNQEKDIHIIK